MKDCPSDRQALLHATRELVGPPVRHRRESDDIQRLVDAPAIDVLKVGEELEVFGCRQGGIKARRVRDVAEVVAEPATLAYGVESRDAEPAGGRPQRGGQNPKQGGLAGAVVAQHRDVLAGIQNQVNPLQRHLGAETMGQPVADDDAHSGLLGEDGGRGGSGGVLRSGQSTKGPDRNRSRVATMMAIATQGE